MWRFTLCWRPLFLSLSGVLLFLVTIWFALCDVDYESPSSFYGLETSGWFLLSLPFTFGFGLLLVLPFCWLAQRKYGIIAWLVVLSVGGLCLMQAFLAALPANRIAVVLQIPPPAMRDIHRLLVEDSFNDGTATLGVLPGSPELLDKIVTANRLEPDEFPFAWLIRRLGMDTRGRLPQDEDQAVFYRGFANEQLSVYLNPTDNRIYFNHRSQ